MKTFLVFLLGIPGTFLSACPQEDAFSFDSAIYWHHMLYGIMYAHHRTYDPVLLESAYEKDIFYSGAQYALENLIQYRDESVKSTQ